MSASYLAVAVGTYALYMLFQYILSPEFAMYEGNSEAFFVFHAAMFVFAGVVVAIAWSSIDLHALPALSARASRFWGVVLLFIAVMFISLHLPTLVEAIQGTLNRNDEYLSGPNNFWQIKFLDLCIAVPFEVITGVALLRGSHAAQKYLYAIIGWFGLVGPSVAAMAAAMLVNDDPLSSSGRVVQFVIIGAVFAGLAVRLYQPLFWPRSREWRRGRA
jgi:hypothetical protein